MDPSPCFFAGSPWQVREAQLAQFNYILVVGAEEEAQKSVSTAPRQTHSQQFWVPAQCFALVTRCLKIGHPFHIC